MDILVPLQLELEENPEQMLFHKYEQCIKTLLSSVHLNKTKPNTRSRWFTLQPPPPGSLSVMRNQWSSASEFPPGTLLLTDKIVVRIVAACDNSHLAVKLSRNNVINYETAGT